MGNFTKLFCQLPVCMVFALCLVSCKDDGGTEVQGYDPSKPVLLEDFYPKTGPIATQVILEGDNFGNTTENVRVWFNQKRASVISAKGNRMLVLAPKLPGEDCTISVVIGSDSTWYRNDVFDYVIQTAVSTIAGGDKNAQENPKGTIPLASAQFKGKPEYGLTVDSRDNLYMAVGQGEGMDAAINLLYQINEEQDQLRYIDEFSAFLNHSVLGFNPVAGNVFIANSNTGMDEYYYLDGNADYVKVPSGSMSWDRSIVINTQMGSWGARKGIDLRPSDGKFYFRSSEAILARFDPETGKGENLSGDDPFVSGGGSTYSMIFDPNDDNIVYFPADGHHCIYKYKIEEKELTVMAGIKNDPGYLDGEQAFAKFSSPKQMCIDSGNNLYVADCDNHCIRRISLETGYVSTVAGIPQQSGYINGTSAVAMFNKPIGLAITSEDVLYIGDSDNFAIRRLAIE